MVRSSALKGWREAGGILGTLITSAGTMHLQILRCNNMGNITGLYAGGMLGATYQLNNVAYRASETDVWGPDDIRIDIAYCANGGTITGVYDKTWDTGSNWGGSVGDAGGIVGMMDQGGAPGGELYISYCLNGGNIRGGRFAGGILAGRTPWNINVCNNTGTAENPSYSASNYGQS